MNVGPLRRIGAAGLLLDLHLYGGLLLAVIGGWQLSRAWSLIGGGLGLILLGLWSAGLLSSRRTPR